MEWTNVTESETTRNLRRQDERLRLLRAKVSLAVGTLALIAAIGYGGHLIVDPHVPPEPPDPPEAWYLVGILAGVGAVALIPGFQDFLLRLVVAINPWKRNGTETKKPGNPEG